MILIVMLDVPGRLLKLATQASGLFGGIVRVARTTLVEPELNAVPKVITPVPKGLGVGRRTMVGVGFGDPEGDEPPQPVINPANTTRGKLSNTVPLRSLLLLLSRREMFTSCSIRHRVSRCMPHGFSLLQARPVPP